MITTTIIRKSGKLRLFVTIIVIAFIVGYLFDFVAPRSFLAPSYLSFRSALLYGTFRVEQIPIFIFLIFSGFFIFLVPSYFGLLLSYSFGAVSLITAFFPFVSILVPAKNNEKEIGKTLDCLLKSDYPKDKMEIIAITSGSTDRTTEICKEYASQGPIRVLEEPLKNKGKPAALNLGVASAKGELIAVYDADTITTPETIRNLVAPLSEPEVSAAIGSIQASNEGENRLTKGASLEYAWYSGAGLLFEIRERLGQGHNNLMGRNYCIRKDLLKSLGGFEETALTEDIHLRFKLRKQEKRIAFSPKAVVKDAVPPKWDTFLMQRSRWTAGFNEENKKYMAQTKNKGKAILGLINFLITGNISLFTPFAIVLAIIFWVLGDYLITMASLLTIIIILALTVVSVYKYGNKKYSLLAYFPVYTYITFFMVKSAFFKPKKGLEWDKTPTE